MKIEFFEKQGEKWASLNHDGKIINRRVYKDEDGEEYFDVPNYFATDVDDKFLKYCFTRRVKDMVETIRSGLGDVISVRTLMVRIDTVRRYVNREYGEELRQKSLAGWKDAKFAFVLGNDGTFGRSYYTTDGTLEFADCMETTVPKFFGSGEEAKECLKKLKEAEPQEFSHGVYVEQVVCSKSNHSIPVYRCGSSDVYYNRGEVLDLGETPVKDTLYLSSDVEPINLPLYAVQNGDITTGWFESRYDALFSDKAQEVMPNGGRLVTATIHERTLKPVSFPFEAVLYEGDRGLFIHKNLDEPENGHLSKRRKYYFPARSCGPFCAGPVVITSITDKGNYGFFTGHMQSFTAPTEKVLAEHFKGNAPEFRGTELRFCEHPLLGTYVKLIHRGQTNTTCCLAANETGEVYTEPSLAMVTGETVTKKVLLWDLLFKEFLGYDSVEEVFSQIVTFPREGAIFARRSRKIYSDLYEEAADTDVFQSMCLNGLEYIDSKFPINLIYFTNNEVQSLIAEVNMINSAAKVQYMRQKHRLG